MEQPEKDRGTFIISLDFEMYWGVQDVLSYNQYKENLDGVEAVVPSLLKIFSNNNIHATWATVGFLFFENRAGLLVSLPEKTPSYFNKKLSPYHNFEKIFSQKTDGVLFAPHLIKQITATPFQEIASHTYCHYYCLEEGQTLEEFRNDLKKAKLLSKSHNIETKSIVFPRNQYNNDYLKICSEEGLICFRGNENAWMYKPSSGKDQSKIKRACRLIDSYINLSGHNTYNPDSNNEIMVNLPASRFFRPYSKKLAFLEKFKINRIKKDLLCAAQKNEVYHLWWHPHNFGKDMNNNLDQLKDVVEYYNFLKGNYNMENKNMGELSEEILKKRIK